MNSSGSGQTTPWPFWLSAFLFVVVASALAVILAIGATTWTAFRFTAFLLALLPLTLFSFIHHGIRPSFTLTTLLLLMGLVACGISLKQSGSPWQQVHQFPVQGVNVTMSADGKLVAASQADSIEIRDTQTGRLVQTLTVSAADTGALGTGMWSCRIGFANSGKSLMTVGWKKYPCLFDVATGKVVRRWPAVLGQSSLALSGTRFMGDSTAVSSPLRQCNVFDIEVDQPILSIEDCHYLFRCISPTGSHVLVGKDEITNPGELSSAELWDVDEQRLVGKIPLPQNQPLLFAKFSLDGNFLAIPTSTGLAVWDVSQCCQIAQWTAANFDSLWSMEWSPDGSRLAINYIETIGPSKPTAAAGKPKRNAIEHSYLLDRQCQVIAAINGGSPAFSPSGNRMATVYGNASVLDGESGEFLTYLPSRPRQSFSGDPAFHFSRDGVWLFHNGGPPTVYQNTRSERWYSVYQLPAFWGVVLLLSALIVRLARSIPIADFQLRFTRHRRPTGT